MQDEGCVDWLAQVLSADCRRPIHQHSAAVDVAALSPWRQQQQQQQLGVMM